MPWLSLSEKDIPFIGGDGGGGGGETGREAFDAFRKEHQWGFGCVSLASPQPFVSKARLELAY